MGIVKYLILDLIFIIIIRRDFRFATLLRVHTLKCVFVSSNFQSLDKYLIYPSYLLVLSIGMWSISII